MNQRERFRIDNPYCLKRRPDGRYIVLNRDYKPVGVATRAWVRYEDFPLESLPGLTPRIAAALSARGSDNVDAVYLYNDGCVPTRSTENMRRYGERLAMLEKLKVSAAPA